MSSRTKAKPPPNGPPYVEWRGRLIAKLALTRAGLVVQDAPPPQPFDLLASTPDGVYFLVEVEAYSSMHGGRRPVFDPPGEPRRWPVDPSLLLAAGNGNLPVVLFVVDADLEVGHYARLDRADRDQRTPAVSLAADRDLSPTALAALVAELRKDSAVSRRLA